jgi:hypothetical protein
VNVFGQEVRTPLVVEKSAKDVIIPGAGVTTIVADNVASIHAKVIDVILVATVDLEHIYLYHYGAAKLLTYQVQIHGNLTAGTTVGIRYGDNSGTADPIGQEYAVVIRTKNAALDGTCTVWTAARS